MDDDREMRAKFCSALRWLEQDIPEEDLNDAVRAVLADTPVRQAVAGLDIPSYVFEEAGPMRGDEPGSMVFGTRPGSAGEWYRCPDGACSLSVVRTPGGELPSGGRCWLRKRPLRLVEA
ncbi:hypothetical protein [Streptomyces sp. NPDC051310]|uniref:hypothetical protein n=1 Tax=Streptomyces sp. NPDC051310 TaxID=3365649 RepID=UPI0037B33F58